MSGREQTVAALLEGTPDAVLTVDADGTIVACNSHVHGVFGYEPDELVGRPVESLIAADQRDGHEAARRAYAGNPSPRFMGERTQLLHGVTKTGDRVEVEISLCPIDDAVLCIVRDVTAMRALEANAIAADRLGLVNVLSAGIAHELRNPLSVIMTEASLALADIGDTHPAARQALEECVHAAEHMREVIRDIELLAKPSSPDQLINVNDCIEHACRLVLAGHRCETPIHMALGQVHPIRGDATRIGQAFVNLVLNSVYAVQHAERPGGDIVVRSGTDGAQVVVEVEDTGGGIPANLLPRVFEPFFTTKGIPAGSGLGLFLVEAIVRDAGGELDIDSCEGSGTTVRISFPVAELSSA